jgi:hypothetical protein
MTTSKHLLLATTACFAMIGAAQAADLPVKAKAVEYVRICSQYGAGFFYIPGTDTCIKLGGYFRADVTFNAGAAHGQPSWSGDPGEQNRFRNYFVDRARMMLNIDTRTSTEYGMVRTYGAAKFQFTTQGAGTINPTTIGPGAVTPATALFNNPGDGYVAVTDLFVQFAGFTFGKSASAYANPWQGTPGNITAFLLGGQQNDNSGPNNIQYTAQFGNGVSATIGLDDPVVWERTAVFNLALPLNATLGGSNAYAGVHAPEFVGNIRVDQPWGLFQISAAAHEVSGSYNILNPTGTAAVPAGALGPPGAAPNTLSEISGHPDTKWGGAVMASLNIKNLPTGTGDDIKMDASYAKGATKYIIGTDATSPSFAMYGGSSRAYQSVGFGATTDAVYLPTAFGGDGALHLTESWGMRGAFNHNWDAHWATSVFGTYSAVRYDATAKLFICANYTTPAKAVSADYVCNPDYNVAQLGANIRWTPVKGLTFTAEAQWFHLDQKFAGTATLAATAPKPTTVYEFRDQDTVLLQVRAQRNF